MARAKRSLYFVADGKDTDGSDASVWVYKHGHSYYLSISGSFEREHLCHPSVKDRSGILREIHLVYQIKVETVRHPDEI